MSHKACSYLLCFTILLVVSSIVSAVNITRALEKYPEFSTMTELFAKTELTPIINKRQTITVLALSNDAIGSVSGRPEDELKNVLMNHVVLDYYDEIKFKAFKEKSTMLTTLYQSTGLGQQQNGFLNCTKSNGKIYFGSAVKGAPQTAEYITTVFRNPYNLSMVQISMPIVAPGLGAPVKVPPPPPMSSSPPAPSPKKAAAETPAPGPAEEEVYADTPLGSAPETAPASAPSEEVDSPAPTPGNAGKKKMEEAADEAEPPTDGASSKTGLSFGGFIVLGVVASLAWF